MTEHRAFSEDPQQVIAACVAALPERIRASALIEISPAHFESAADQG